MKNKSLRIKILSGMLCTGLTFSTASFSFAAVNQNNSESEKPATSIDFRASMEGKKVAEEKHTEMKVEIEAVIKDSVRSNIITQTEGDKVLEYVTTKFAKKCEDDKKCKREKYDHAKGGLFKELVAEGILTKEKADALREKMYEKKSQIKNEELQKGLTTLVDNKVLTIEQSNKVKDAIMAAEAQRKEEYRKMRGMSEKERKSHMKKMKDTKINPVKALVDDGTITRDQEKEIQKIMHHHHHHDDNHDNK